MGNNEIIEKAKQWQVGDESTDKHGVTYYVHHMTASGKPAWRKKDDGAKTTKQQPASASASSSVSSNKLTPCLSVCSSPTCHCLAFSMISLFPIKL